MFDYNNSQLEINLPQERPALESELAVMSPLGIIDEIGLRSNSSRLLRYVLKEISADLLPKERVAKCNHLILPGFSMVGVSYSPKWSRAHYLNLMQCSSIWFCPVCAYKIIQKRHEELQRGISAYKSAGGYAYMVTFTNQHSKEDSLAWVLKVLQDSVRKVLTSRFWSGLKDLYEIEGSIGALENRYGENGWHPHKHFLFLCRRQLSESDLNDLDNQLNDRYIYELEKRGSTGIKGIAVEVTEDHENGGYLERLEKWSLGAELTRGELKVSRAGSRSPFGLLAGVLSGSKEDSRLYLEYYRNFKGLRQLVLHKGTRQLLNLAIMKSDKELVEETEPDSYVLAWIAKDIWRKVCERKLQGQLLDVADSGSSLAVEEFLRRLYE